MTGYVVPMWYWWLTRWLPPLHPTGDAPGTSSSTCP